MAQHHALFLDVFGTLVEDHGVFEKVESLVFKRHAAQALRRFSARKYLVVLSVCQPGADPPDGAYLPLLRAHLQGKLVRGGLPAESLMFIAPEGEEAGKQHQFTAQRLRAFAAAHDIDLHASTVIGDRMSDVRTGKQLGCTTVLLSSTADCPGFEDTDWVEPHYIVEDMSEAADALLGK
ncbi:HAD hydrolase-like protein [bacterium]|nr:HAD hydrolase-like protein [bacterium]